MVTGFFERLGNVGVLLIAGALLVGGLAGGAVVHQYERTSAKNVASQQHNDKDEKKQAKNKGKGKQKNAHKNHQQGDPAEKETD